VTLEDEAEAVLRRVLARELRLTNLEIDDDLVGMDHDIPEEEVLMDVLEEFGYRGQIPMYSHWSGTFRDLLNIVLAELKRLGYDRV